MRLFVSEQARALLWWIAHETEFQGTAIDAAEMIRGLAAELIGAGA
jgi:hypothetical protein